MQFLFCRRVYHAANCAGLASQGYPTKEIRALAHPSSPVHSISLPHDEAFAPLGPGRDAFVTACIVCHSPRYITSQPPFSRAVWKGIVQKMIDAFGAHITTTQAAEIVDYLAATNGAHVTGGEGE
jgi:hypothetical protein